MIDQIFFLLINLLRMQFLVYVLLFCFTTLSVASDSFARYFQRRIDSKTKILSAMLHEGNQTCRVLQQFKKRRPLPPPNIERRFTV